MSSETYKFAQFTLNPAKRTLCREGAAVKLRDKDFDVLLFLLENAPNLCTFDEIIRGVWGGTNVENSSVEKAIANIRKHLADDARNPRFIKTVRTKGYLFCGDVERFKEEHLEEAVSLTEKRPSENIMATHRSQTTSPPQSQKFKWILCGSVVALLMISVMFWWRGTNIWKSLRSEVVFADDFSDGVINANRWKVKGKSVKPIEGTIKLSVDETDNPGILRSNFFSVDPTKPIIIESRLRVTFSQNMKDKVYFGGMFGFIPKTLYLEKINILEDDKLLQAEFTGVRYMNYDSSESYKDVLGREFQDIKTEGFFLVRDGSRAHIKAEYAIGKVSERIKPVWGKWFEQKIVYNPVNGLMMFFIDGEKRGEFVTSRLRAKDNQIMFEIMPWGWWVNHSMEFDYIRVTQ
jgi:DNA-binding winged helix-turn-helix (wHTH) protein